MEALSFELYVMVLFIVLNVNQANNCIGYINMTLDGEVLKDHVFNHRNTIGVKQCARECRAITDCLSYNFNHNEFSCQLNSADSLKNSLDSDNKYRYGERNNIPQVLSSGNTSCGAGYKRVSFKNGVTKCISILVDKPDSCKNTIMGTEYRGTLSTAFSGIICQEWALSSPHSHSYTSLPSNVCRNPSSDAEGPWCYTVDPNVRWRYCDIPLCIYKKPAECKDTTLGYEYMGFVNTTVNGRQCQDWITDTPHGHSFHHLAANYCRNPDTEPNGPWCYTVDAAVRWEYCNVPFC